MTPPWTGPTGSHLRIHWNGDDTQLQLTVRAGAPARLGRDDPQNLHLYRDCVTTALQSAAFDVVVSLAQEQLQLGSDPWAARFDWASGLIGQQDYARALLQLEHLPENAHQHPAVLLNRGLCHYCLDADDAIRARQWARTTLQLHPGSVDGRLVQATLLTMRLQKDRARGLLEGVVAEAAVAALRGDGSRAQSLLEVARRLDADCPSAVFAEAMLRARAGDPAQAQRMVAERIASLGPGDGSPLAQLLTQVGRGRLQ
jgi:hypothetical protein